MSDTAVPIRRRATAVRETVIAGMIWTTALLVMGIFVALVGHVVWHGVGRLSLAFLTEVPRDAGRLGGIGPILVSTVVIVGIALSAALPLALGTAILLAECPARSRFATVVRRSLDVLAGVPSIVFGLFGNALFCVYLEMGLSVLSGGLTLACMVLPILIRSTEQGLRGAADAYRGASAALGLSRITTLWHLLLPAAIPGLVVGLVLGIGRAAAETAALIFTAGYVDRVPTSLLDPGRALSVHIYELSMNIPGGDEGAHASALVLLLLLLLINAVASGLAHYWMRRKVQIS